MQNMRSSLATASRCYMPYTQSLACSKETLSTGARKDGTELLAPRTRSQLLIAHPALPFHKREDEAKFLQSLINLQRLANLKPFYATDVFQTGNVNCISLLKTYYLTHVFAFRTN